MPKILAIVNRETEPTRECTSIHIIIPPGNGNVRLIARFEWRDYDLDGNAFNQRNDPHELIMTENMIEAALPANGLPSLTALHANLSAFVHAQQDAADAVRAE